jgi:hypothetical protein
MRLRIQLLQKWTTFAEVMRKKINVAERGEKREAKFCARKKQKWI